MLSNAERFAGLPLRERKAARLRVGLARACVRGLAEASLEALAVRQLCDEVEVSEATFFNYFPRKTDLLRYWGQLQTLALAWHGQRAAVQRPGLTALEAVFEHAGQQIQAAPQAALALIALQATQRESPRRPEIGAAERWLAFPDLDGIETLPVCGLDGLLQAQLQQAVELGELPANTHLPSLMAGLSAIYFGVPLAMRGSVAGLPRIYRQQLQLTWAGWRSLTQRPPPTPRDTPDDDRSEQIGPAAQ